MPMIVSICQHCDEQQFRNTVMCSYVPYTIFSVVKLDLCIRALLLDHILVLQKIRVRLACILLTTYKLGLSRCIVASTGYSTICRFLLQKIFLQHCQNPMKEGNSLYIKPSEKVRDLGVILDQTLSFDDHISTICQSAHFHIRNIGRIRN